VLCRECNQVLPDGAQVCSDCGTLTNAPAVTEIARTERSKQNKHQIFTYAAIAILLVLVAAATVFQDEPLMQTLRDRIGSSQQRTLGDSVFALTPEGFRSFKFAIPTGASDVSVRGDFTVSPVVTQGKNRLGSPDDEAVEAFVLSEAAFVVWRNGYSAGSEYESGLHSRETINAHLPSEPGIYYLVFSNRSSPRIAKTVRANILLSYKNWLPDGFLAIKDRFINWLDL
jgi:predicted nucleic acid-binding Zn ribbon protein